MLARLLRWWRGRSAADRDRVLHDLPEVMLSTTDTLVERFSFHGIDSAFIGGIALAMHGLPRATRDIDFIIDAGSADSADALMAELGFERLQRSDIFGNYLLGPLRVDLLFTQGDRSRRILRRAQPVRVRRNFGKLVRPDDLIGLKLQAMANDSTRAFDQGDITNLLKRFSGNMDMALVRDYFRVFDKEAELDAILEAIAGGSGGDPSRRG